MSKHLDKYIKSCDYADTSHFDKETNTYHIRKYAKPTFDVNKSYVVKINKMFLNNKDTVAAVNWNRGRSPSDEFMLVCVSKVLGKMIYVDGIAYDVEESQTLSNMYSGWIPADEMTQITVL